MQTEEKKLTGYPSIDKPWLKYYSEEAINAPLPKMTMYQYAWENNKDYPADIAFRYFDSKITYGEFFENVKKTAKAFSAMGIVAEDIVTIMSMHTPETVYAIYALNYIGAVANLVYMTLSENEILHTVENTDSKMFLFLDAAADRVAHIRSEIKVPVVMLSVADSMPKITGMFYRLKSRNFVENTISFREFLEKGKDYKLPSASTAHEKMAVIVYTSGTTGEPKGVMLSNDALNAHAFQDINGIFSFERRLTFLFILPTFVGFGISQLHTFLCAGINLSLHIKMMPSEIVKEFYRNVPQCFIGGPALIASFMSAEYFNRDLSNLKFFVGGGGEISKEDEMKFNIWLKDHHSSAIYSCGYGLTETSSTLCACCNGVSKIGSAGIPFFRTNVKVVNPDTGVLLQYGEIGELLFSTPNMMNGYYCDKIATDAVMHCDNEGSTWIKTGDLGYVDRDGFIFVTGRIKRIYLSKSVDGVVYKLFPQRIEELLLCINTIERCAVIAMENAKRINVAIAFVTAKEKNMGQDKRNELISDLYALAKRELPEHEQPADIILIDEMPLTPSGKIDYRKLEEIG